jgi:hypothetical protein
MLVIHLFELLFLASSAPSILPCLAARGASRVLRILSTSDTYSCSILPAPKIPQRRQQSSLTPEDPIRTGTPQRRPSAPSSAPVGTLLVGPGGPPSRSLDSCAPAAGVVAGTAPANGFRTRSFTDIGRFRLFRSLISRSGRGDYAGTHRQARTPREGLKD